MADGTIITWILSGGGSPGSNYYSQYLQAKRLTEFFTQQPDTKLTTMFGAGYTPDSSPDLPPDVAQRTSAGGATHFIRGVLPDNHPATYADVHDYVETQLPTRAWAPGDRFLLIIADHGMPNRWDPRTWQPKQSRRVTNNCINLWQPQLSTYPEQQCLSVEQLQNDMATAIPKDVPVNFVMAQCFSGGFHALAFSQKANALPIAHANRCGFTATTDDALASGCMSFVSEAHYDGYERRIAEAITGVDILSGKTLHAPIERLSEAHDEAMRLDNTNDIPMRSSDAFLLACTQTAPTQSSPTDAMAHILSDTWKKIDRASFTPVGLSPLLVADLARRRALIADLAQRFEQWHPEYRGSITTGGLRELEGRRAATTRLLSAMRKQSAALQKKIDATWNPLCQTYIAALAAEKNVPDTREWWEFETVRAFEDNELVYSRFAERDPTLALLARYVNYERHRENAVVAWAEATYNIAPNDLRHLIQQLNARDTLDERIERTHVIEGQLRRITTQMQAAATIAWLADTQQNIMLGGVATLVRCEMSARITP